MLQEIRVEHYAVVEKLSIRFRAGLNLLTGETGSGKSIVVDALSLLLGARATVDVIRAGCKRARITGVFEVERNARAARPVRLRWVGAGGARAGRRAGTA